jgi:hypothetical protein
MIQGFNSSLCMGVTLAGKVANQHLLFGVDFLPINFVETDGFSFPEKRDSVALPRPEPEPRHDFAEVRFPLQPSKGMQSEPHPRSAEAAGVPGRCSTPRVGVMLIRASEPLPVTHPSPSTMRL